MVNNNNSYKIKKMLNRYYKKIKGILQIDLILRNSTGKKMNKTYRNNNN